MRILAEAWSIGIARTKRAPQFIGTGLPDVFPAAADQVVCEGVQHLELLLKIVDECRRSEHHRRAVVHRMMKGRPGQNESIDVRDRQARRHALCQRPQHAAGGRSVYVDRLADPDVDRRNHERLAVDNKPEMTNEPQVKDLVDGRPVINAPRGQALDRCAFGWFVMIGHNRVPSWFLPLGFLCGTTVDSGHHTNPRALGEGRAGNKADRGDSPASRDARRPGIAANPLTPRCNCINILSTDNQGAFMQYEINSASRLPIYQQLVQQVREAIARGELEPEAQLPSVRQLSRDLVINPNTVARAYTELEREGLLNNRPGRGVFVATPKDELTKDARRRRLLESLDRFLTEAVHLGFAEEEVARLVTTRSRQFQWNPGKAGSK